MAHTPASVSVSARLRLRDVFHPAVAGLVSVIVNYGGTFILVFQAARVAGWTLRTRRPGCGRSRWAWG